MRKTVTPASQPPQPGEDWLDLDALAQVEITSEDDNHPIEGALVPGKGDGWRAAGPGEQTIRLLFDEPQRVRRIRLEFAEPAVERTQEFVLRWARAGEEPGREIVRQRWNFSPGGATSEAEEYEVDLPDATVLEVSIIPDVSGTDARASLALLRLA